MPPIHEFPTPTAASMGGAITAGPDGNLWFSEDSVNKIAEFNPATPQSSTEFTVPAADGDLSGLTAGPDGNLWFTVNQANMIGEINPATHVVNEFPIPTAGSNPTAMTVGPDGNLWFTELDGNKIGEFNPATPQTINEFTIPSANTEPAGITAGPDGNVWFVESAIESPPQQDGNRIGEVNLATGAISEFPIPTSNSEPGQIVAGPDGNLWFSESQGHKIGEINPVTDAINEFPVPSAKGNLSGALTIGPDNNLWFSEAGKIGKFNVATHAVKEFAVPTAGGDPSILTAGPDGNLWYTKADPGNTIGEVALVPAISALTGNNQSTTVGTAFGTLLEVQVIDVFGDPISGASVTFTEADGSRGAGGAFSDSTTVTTNAQGLALAPVLTANDMAGSFTVTATLGALATTFHLNNLPGDATKLALANVPASVTAGQNFNFQVDVEDQYGNRVTDDDSEVTATLSGPGTFTGGSTTVQAVNGVASFTGMAIQTAGSYTVSLSLAKADILYVANSGDNTIHRFSATGTDLGGFSADGNEPLGLAFDSTGTLYVSLYADNVIRKFSPSGTDLGIFANSGMANPGGMVFDASGNLYVDNYHFQNGAPGPRQGFVRKYSPTGADLGFFISPFPTGYVIIKDTNGNFYIDDFGTTPTPTEGARKFSPTGVDLGLIGGSQQYLNPEGMALDTNGNLYLADTDQNVIREFSPTGADLGVFANTGLSTPRDLVFDEAGNLYVSNWANNTIREFSPRGVDLGNFATTGLDAPRGLVFGGPTTSFALPVTAAAPNAISPVAGTTPQAATVGLAYATNLAVLVTDAYGNPASGVVVTFAAPATTTAPSGTFAGSATVPTNSSGIATAPAFTADQSAGTFQVSASAGAAVTAFTLSNLAGTPAAIRPLTGMPQSATVATAFAPLGVLVTDSFGNPVSGAGVTFVPVAGSNGATGTFAGNASITTDARGVGIAPALTAGQTAGRFTVAATVGGVASPATFLLTDTPGAPASITATNGTSQNTPLGSAYGALLQAKVTDAFGNSVPHVPVTFAAPTGGASGNFNALATVPSNSLGIATAPTFTANHVPGSFTVTASAPGIATPASFTLTNTTIPAAIRPAAGTPQHVAVTGSYANLQALVTDADGNPVSGITVEFALPASGPSGTFAGPAAVVTNASGVAQAPALTANQTAGAFTVTAWVAGVAAPAKFLLTNTPGAPKAVNPFLGTPQSATVTTAYATPLQAQVLDAFGNPVGGVQVTFAAPASGVGGTFAGKVSATAVTASNGVATAPALTANTHAGSFTVSASISGVSAPASFSLTNLAGPVASVVAVKGSTPQSTARNAVFAVALAVQVTDRFGNPEGGVVVTFTVHPNAKTGAAATFTGGSLTATVTTAVNGQSPAAPALTADADAGSFTVLASIAGVSADALFTLTIL
ncbi:MAG TPA: Ig-like domain-containing protein [Gemmataceae bacterium]|nr:Ig-like domain-containing protein [Gemmataceae bacterium]